MVDTLKDPLGTLRARCVAAAEPGADGGVKGVGIADGANGLEDLGEIIDDQGYAFERGCDTCELVRGEKVVDRGERGGKLLLLLPVELPLAGVEEDIVAICDGAKSLDATEFNFGAAAVEGPLVCVACEEGKGTNVCACEGLGGIDDGEIPEDGVGKGENGGNAERV